MIWPFVVIIPAATTAATTTAATTTAAGDGGDYSFLIKDSKSQQPNDPQSCG